MSETTQDKIVQMIKELKGLENLDIKEALIDSGVLDSFDLINLIVKMEERFKISIPGTEISPENLNYISDIALLVERTLSANTN